VKPSIVLTEAAKEKAMKAKAYIESKYRKLDTQERERNEGKIIPAKLIFIAWEMLAKKMNLLNLNEAE
jgi:hypothetical protein